MIQFASEASGPEAVKMFCVRLLAAKWENPTGPMRLSTALTLQDLENAPFLSNARIFLAALGEKGGTPATATGNLTRSFVGEILDKLALSERHRESIISTILCRNLD